MKDARDVSFFVDGAHTRTFSTDRPIEECIAAYVKDARLRGIRLEGKTVRAEARTGENHQEVVPDTWSSGAQRMRARRRKT